MRYDIGDKVYTKIAGATIISKTSNQYDAILSFNIIGIGLKDEFCVIYIPEYYRIKDRFQLQEKQLDEYLIDKEYLFKNAIAIWDSHIVSIQRAGVDGMFCEHCKLFIPWAQSNQPDGTLLCYSCRANPWR